MLPRDGMSGQLQPVATVCVADQEITATGPHLHIEVVSPGGTKVDPRRWLDERGIGC